jgi:demethylmenaquinone methyltransferase/2-methoxy-6-polyprenyl-1,4-benzoquinol methylase
MVDGLDLPRGSSILDVAAGTGSITRLLQSRGYNVVSLDQSPEMTKSARTGGATAILATAEHLPIADATFDAVTFGYLLRYVDDVATCIDELTRVVRPGGAVAMVEFSQPRQPWLVPWLFYTRVLLPAAGRLIGSGWTEVGQFLGPSIAGFARRYPPDRLTDVWVAAGLSSVHYAEMSLGGGLVMWGRRR